MRKCENCYKGHYSTSPDSEYMYCDLGGVETITTANDCCESHRYADGEEAEKNYIFLDDSSVSPGYIIVNVDVETNKLNSFLKFWYTEGNNKTFGIRAYSINQKQVSDGICSKEFTFRDIEDDESGLFDCFWGLLLKLSGNPNISSVGALKGISSFKLEGNNEIIRIIVSMRTQNPINAIEVILGNVINCNLFNLFRGFYGSLSKIAVNNRTPDKIKRLVLEK